jgi:ABC-type Na+ efflux pump permease subunit
LFVGPVFTREAVTAPRRLRFYAARAIYSAGLLALVSTAWLLLTGAQEVRNIGDMARFGATLFQILAPLQLALALFFAAVLAASAVAQEKDRRTLVLLLMTNLSNSELVLGKLFSSLLQLFVLLAAGLPVFLLVMLFGGTSYRQIAWVYAATLITALAAGSIGSTLALWREKTFQTLALAFLVLMFWLAAAEVVIAVGAFGPAGNSLATWGAGLSPWRAVLIAARPDPTHGGSLPGIGSPLNLYLCVAAAVAIAANALAIWRVRIWNPSREMQPVAAGEDVYQRADVGVPPSGGMATALPPKGGIPTRHKSRDVWSNPILWREVRTWAYGRKVLAIRVAYLLLWALSAIALHAAVTSGSLTRMGATLLFAPLAVLSLMLVNALAVTSVTTERDLGALDLLLVTDLTPPEFIFGKLGGALYVAKEMIVLPLLLCGYLWWSGAVTFENLSYLLLALALAYLFVATLGIHVGLSYANSRQAVAVSLGTVFFLFVGIAVCMRIMMSFSGSFELQLTPFLVFMVGGWIALFVALGVRNPSAALAWASGACPVFTFIAITSFLQGQTLGVFLVFAGAYGFTTAAMLIPAIYDFDIATGRTTQG